MFGEGGSRAFIDSAAVQPAYAPNLAVEDTLHDANGGEAVRFAAPYVRDFPYGEQARRTSDLGDHTCMFSNANSRSAAIAARLVLLPPSLLWSIWTLELNLRVCNDQIEHKHSIKMMTRVNAVCRLQEECAIAHACIPLLASHVHKI